MPLYNHNIRDRQMNHNALNLNYEFSLTLQHVLIAISFKLEIMPTLKTCYPKNAHWQLVVRTSPG